MFHDAERNVDGKLIFLNKIFHGIGHFWEVICWLMLVGKSSAFQEKLRCK